METKKGTVEVVADRLMPRPLRPFWNRVRTSNLGYRLAHGAFWATIGAGLSQALMLATSMIAARILGREQFGHYGIVISTVGMFGIFAGFGLGTTATKFVAEHKYSDPCRAGRIIAMSSLVAIAIGALATLTLLVIAPLLAAGTLAAPELGSLLRLAAAMVLFGAINSAQFGALAGFEAFRSIAKINFVAGISTFCCVSFGIVTSGMVGALIGQVVAMAIGCLLSNYALRKECEKHSIKPSYSGCWVERDLLLSFSLPAVLSGVLVSPVNWACSAILVNQPAGYAEMGLFNAANSWQKAILFLPGSIGAIALPMLSALRGSNDSGGYRKALWYNMGLNGVAAFAVFLGVSLFSKFIMRGYGQAFENGFWVLILLSFSAFLIAVGSVVGNALASSGRMWYGFVFNAIWAIVYLTMAGYLVPRKGAIGLAMANVVAYIIHTAVQSAYALSNKSR